MPGEPVPPPGRPEWYEIVIQGHLDARRAACFEGLAITLLPDGQTLLAGPIIDQAQLYGLLSRIRDLGTPLLAVRRTGGCTIPK